MSRAQTTESFGDRLQRRVAYLAGKWWFWLAVMSVPFSWPFYYSWKQDLPPPLMTYGQLPEFELVDHRGQPFGTEQLRGKMWVASFVLTRCETPCDEIMAQMQEIQHRSRHMGEAFHMVTFTVDPDHDTVPVLAEYAHSLRASETGWSFLTGENRDVELAVVQGMKIAFGRKANPGADGELHSTHLVLIDQNQRIRGYYDTMRERAIDYLLRDAAFAFSRDP